KAAWSVSTIPDIARASGAISTTFTAEGLILRFQSAADIEFALDVSSDRGHRPLSIDWILAYADITRSKRPPRRTPPSARARARFISRVDAAYMTFNVTGVAGSSSSESKTGTLCS